MQLPSKVLVTGGAGFIGSHLVAYLLCAGCAVTVVDDFNDYYDPALKRRNVAAWGDRVRVIQADICDQAPLRDVFRGGAFDAVVHLAARAGVRPSLQQPALYTQVNVVGTQNLLDLARAAGVPKFIFASSSSVYGLGNRAPFREADAITRPISPYAATKLAGEALCHVAHHLYGMDVACLRLFTVYGPRQRPDLAIHKFTRAILTGDRVEVYGDGSARRDFTHVDDIVDGLVACLTRRLGYEIINLGESRTISVRELIQLIEHSAGRRANIEWQPAQPGDVPLTHADVTKARELLDYRPSRPIAAGIEQFVAWMREQTGLEAG